MQRRRFKNVISFPDRLANDSPSRHSLSHGRMAFISRLAAANMNIMAVNGPRFTQSKAASVGGLTSLYPVAFHTLIRRSSFQFVRWSWDLPRP
jgi:hypothetical protein